MRLSLGLAGALIAATLAAAPAWAQTAPPEAATTPAPAATPAAAQETAETRAEPTFGDRVAQQAGELGRVDQDDLAALKTYYSANPGKPLWLDNGALSARAQAAMAEIARADDWGLRAADFALPADAGDRSPDAQAKAETQLTMAVLKYARHARGGRVDTNRLSESLDRTGNLIEPAKVLEAVAAAPAADAYLRGLHPRHPQFERLRKLYLALRAGTYQPDPPPAVVEPAPEQPSRKGRKAKKSAQPKKPAAPPQVTAERVLANMEQWRWMPDDLGRLHAIVNIPEFTLRVVKGDSVIHSERVVVGTAANQTPIFSKQMQTVVFQPGWGVPQGIKVKELLPRLLAGGDPITDRGLVVRYRGREADPYSIDWRTVDIRKVSIVQPPGPSNALGMVKFLFPNKHDVYMHDTPSKSLFNADVRAFSHGCVRVRNPMRFAEVVFAETGGWPASRVASLARGKPENEVPVPGQLDVHMTYFTVTVGDDGKPHTFRDIYGHEPRILAGIEGRYDKVPRKYEDLGQVRTSLINSVRSSRRVAYAEVERPSRANSASRSGSRSQSGAGRSAASPRTATRSSGGGGGSFFNIFSGF